MATTIDQIDQIKAEYRVTNEQLDCCTLILECSTGRYFYQVDSASGPEKVYTVRYDQRLSKLSCTCKAGEFGMDCGSTDLLMNRR
jgi:hypothetical protein